MLDPRGRKIEFAPQVKIDAYLDMVDSFVYRVFGIEGGAFVTDESELYDFDSEILSEDVTFEERTTKIVNKVKKVYGVDISDIEDLNLADVLQRIRILKE